MSLEIFAVPGIPEVREGDDLGAVVATAVRAAGLELHSGDILVIASKVVSKSLGLRRYASRDSVIADETVRVVAERRAGDRVTRVVESVAGPVMAAAGVDESNVGEAGGVLVLPRDADAAAAEVLASVRAAWESETGGGDVGPLGVVVSDTAGRPWRAGVVDFALGSAGVRVLEDHRGGVDADGRELSVTVIAVADEIAAAADLVKSKSGALPVAVVRGLPWASDDVDEPGAGGLVRIGPGDWFRTGPVEALRAALGVEPGSAESESIGIRAVGALEDVEVRAGRVVALAGHGSGAGVTGRMTGSDAEVRIEVEASSAYGLGRVVERVSVAAASEDLEVVGCEVAGLRAVVTVRSIWR
ncbi:coenzyme F420-0:L-glutamate ligase [Nostocoides sp. F2B08]|uniref:coenzyme F420-0:L-glutamate ligase n=1 Tax=Nostocoides sp. F2B08 TaxID=2653936 RepID=UPI001D03AEDF|nr:coenzyme F420-0:L-glutamate ligase [Tetrasphaera sp. F2B08]